MDRGKPIAIEASPFVQARRTGRRRRSGAKTGQPGRPCRTDSPLTARPSHPTAGRGAGPPPYAGRCSGVLRHKGERRVEHVKGESPRRTQMLPHLCQAGDPVRLRHIVQERPKRANDQRESFREIERAHVARHHGDAGPNVGRRRLQLQSKSLEHRLVGIERVDIDAGPRDGQGNPPGAGAKFEHRSSSSLGLIAVPVDISLQLRRCDDIVQVRLVRH